MKVMLAENAGACYGVQRALDMALAAAEDAEATATKVVAEKADAEKADADNAIVKR